MNQEKIGEYIRKLRKENNLSQKEFADKLCVTFQAVSKWENGNCIPDVSNIQELCKILNITINDLFSGCIVDMKDNEKKLEENLLEMIRIKEQRDRELLILETFIGVTVSIIMFLCIMIASFVQMDNWIRILLIVFGVIPFVIGICYAIRIEQIAGYYECSNCNYKYIPTYKSVLFSMHFNRTRKMKCPNCNKKSWHKKVISK